MNQKEDGIKAIKFRFTYRSLKRFLIYLLSYKKYFKLNIPNATNLFDNGYFSSLKDKLKVHRKTNKEKIKL